MTTPLLTSTVRTAPTGWPLPEIDDITRRDLLKGAGALLVAAACGTDGEGRPAAPSPRFSTRTFDHFAGTTQVPVRPQRIVTLHDANALAPLWELGVRNIVGSVADLQEGEPFYRGVSQDEFSDITFVGEYGEPDLERVAALRPDLIVGHQFQEDIYEQASRVASTVLIEFLGLPIEDYYGQFAELVGAEERAAELHRRYQERLQEIRDLVGEPSQVVVSLIATGPSAEVGQIYTQHAANQVHTMLKEIGFARPAPQLDDDEGHTLSLERLPSQDGDLLLRYLDTGGALDTVEIATP